MRAPPSLMTRRRALTETVAATIALGEMACSRSRATRGATKRHLGLGFLRQTDAASLLMAEELGYYAKQDLAVTFRRGISPGDLHALLTRGDVVAAQMSAPTPVLAALAGSALGPGEELRTLMVLAQNGGAITLTRELCDTVGFLDLDRLRRAIQKRSQRTFAVPILGGTDDLSLRYFLAASGFDHADYQIVSTPPERMVADLREDRIVGFAAADPWHAVAAQSDVGFTVATTQDIWRYAPRTVLVTTVKQLDQRRAELKAVVRAVLEASSWLDVPANRADPLLVEVLSRRDHLDLDAPRIRARLRNVYDLGCRVGDRDFEEDILYFHRAGRVNFPRRADALLQAALLLRFGLVQRTASPPVVASAIHDEIYREVAAEMGIPLPDDMKPFVVTLDAVRFDPARPEHWNGLWARDLRRH